MPTPSYLRATEGGVLLAVRLQPRAGRGGIGAPHGDELRIRVTAPPHRGEANEALVRLLAYTLRCGPNRVEIVRGAASGRKTLMLHGFTEPEVAQAIGGRARRPGSDAALPPRWGRSGKWLERRRV